ncbi:hypothetical protein [Candidatus Oscillochloris fontis]|uniref:hypothetical protein n=1 Tax=Candidatus Oscillochloris fontis TaxID=2496868 RepID=UPI00101BC6B9|nr:hypothetical protein [Candidatus Oscillochloris fontis]
MATFFLFLLGGLLLLSLVGWGTFWILVQLGVIVQKAVEPPTTDTNNYSLDQGRDVGKRDH